MGHHPAPDIACRIRAEMAHVRRLLDTVKAAMEAAQVAPTLTETSQIVLAEVLNNVVEHACRYESGHALDLAIWLTPDGITCEVCDDGRPMPTGGAPEGNMPDVRSEVAALPEGGFGWALVRKLTQGIDYNRQDGRNRLRFEIPAPIR